jgi:GlcNAc-P-P-Und epimerase
MNRVFVTGGSGFIGTNLVERLRAEQVEVLNYDWKPPRERSAEDLRIGGDILDGEKLGREMKKFRPDVVIHLAARCDLAGKTLDDYAANTVGVKNVIEAVKAVSSVSRTVFASSRYVHRNEEQPERDDIYSPFTMYGASKAEGEKIVRASQLETPWLIVRPTSIWGPWFDIPYKGFFQAVRRGLYFHPKGEKIYKSYGYVGNVVHQILKLQAAAHEPHVNRRTFYVADYEPVEVGSMAETIRDYFGAPSVRHAPIPMMRSMAKVGDAFKALGWYNPPLTSFRLNNLRVQMVYNISSTAEVVGVLPFSMSNGIKNTVEWMKQHD